MLIQDTGYLFSIWGSQRSTWVIAHDVQTENTGSTNSESDGNCQYTTNIVITYINCVDGLFSQSESYSG